MVTLSEAMPYRIASGISEPARHAQAAPTARKSPNPIGLTTGAFAGENRSRNGC
jgi:hypothetical protein